MGVMQRADRPERPPEAELTHLFQEFRASSYPSVSFQTKLRSISAVKAAVCLAHQVIFLILTGPVRVLRD